MGNNEDGLCSHVNIGMAVHSIDNFDTDSFHAADDSSIDTCTIGTPVIPSLAPHIDSSIDDESSIDTMPLIASNAHDTTIIDSLPASIVWTDNKSLDILDNKTNSQVDYKESFAPTFVPPSLDDYSSSSEEDFSLIDDDSLENDSMPSIAQCDNFDEASNSSSDISIDFDQPQGQFEQFPVVIQEGMDLHFTITGNDDDISVATKGSATSCDTIDKRQVTFAIELSDNHSEGSPVPPISNLHSNSTQIFHYFTRKSSFSTTLILLALMFLAYLTIQRSRLLPLSAIALRVLSSLPAICFRAQILLNELHKMHSTYAESRAQSIQDNIDKSCGIELYCVKSWCDSFTPELVQNHPLDTSYSIDDSSASGFA